MSTKREPGIGHNSEGADNIAADQLRLFVERVERLEEEKKAQQDDIKDVYLEAKSQGYDPKYIRYVVKMRAMEKQARDEMLAMQETYLAAMGLA